MITQRHIERDGDRILWRILVNEVAALDVLTNAEALTRARIALEAPQGRGGLLEEPLGTFGPFDVTMSRTGGESRVALALDGPDLGSKFQGNQAMVLYLDAKELLTALRID